MSKRNDPIGTVECPTKGCSQQCNVFRFRERGASEKSVANRRFAGKLYARCPKHGTFGGSAGDQEMQEYILCHAKMHAPGAGDRSSTPAIAPSPAPAKQAPRPASSPATTKPRSSETSAAPASETPAKKGGWGWFQ